MAEQRAFVYAVCGAAAHIRALHRSLEYLRPRTTLPIRVVTDRRRNAIAIDHSDVIDIETPAHLDHHQASIWLKTSLHRLLPAGVVHAYLDSDIIAARDGVDAVFEHQYGPVTFARDLTRLQSRVSVFSPWAMRCSCDAEAGQTCAHLSQAIARRWGVQVDDDWVQWNGGVFVIGALGGPFMEMWHQRTLQVFADPAWNTRDQGTLIATVWSLGLQHQRCLPQPFNFIVCDANSDLRVDPALGYSLHASIPPQAAVLLHLMDADLDRPGWTLGADVEAGLLARSRREEPRHAEMPRAVPMLAPETRAWVAAPPQAYRVIVGRPRSGLDGHSDFAETLVRGLRDRGLDAHVLLTELDTERVVLDAPALPLASDLPFARLPAAPQASWGARWGTLVRYLELQAPCVYLPVGDWRNAIVAPQLSERVAVVGCVLCADAQHLDEWARLGDYWNAVVVPDLTVAAALAEGMDPAGGRAERQCRITVIPPGLAVGPDRGDLGPPDDGVLRIIHVGALDLTATRCLLAQAVDSCRDQGMALELTVVGDALHRDLLLAESRHLVDGNALRWLGVVPHAQLLATLAQQDVLVMTVTPSDLPQVIVEAMSQGCVPVVADAPVLDGLVRDGVNGLRITVADARSFGQALHALHAAPALRRAMADAARQTVIDSHSSVAAMAAAYADLFDRVMATVDQGGLTGRPGPLLKPPLQVDGQVVFPVRYQRGIAGVGVFPSYREDYEDYRHAVGTPFNHRLPAWTAARVQPFGVTLAAGRRLDAPANRVVAALARGLRQADQPVRVVAAPGALAGLGAEAFGADVPVTVAAIGVDSPGGAWQAMARQLEDQAPCLYLPSADGPLACLDRQLSDRIGIIGRVDDLSPLLLARAARRARAWNRVVAGSDAVADRLLRIDASLAPRLVTIAPPLALPRQWLPRPLDWGRPLRLAHQATVTDSDRMQIDLARVMAALTAAGVPVQALAVDNAADADLFLQADALLLLHCTASTPTLLLQAMARGCVPVLMHDLGALTALVVDGHSGQVVARHDHAGLIRCLAVLQHNPALRRHLAAGAFEATCHAGRRDEDVYERYALLFERVLHALVGDDFRRRSVSSA